MDCGAQSLLAFLILVIFVNNEKRSPFIASAIQGLLRTESIATDWNDNPWVAMQRMNTWNMGVAVTLCAILPVKIVKIRLGKLIIS